MSEFLDLEFGKRKNGRIFMGSVFCEFENYPNIEIYIEISSGKTIFVGPWAEVLVAWR